MRKEVGPRSKKEPLTCTRRVTGVVKRSFVKARAGRGRKRQPWVSALYAELLEDFRHSRRAGIEMNRDAIKAMALNLIRDVPEESSFHRLEKDVVSKKPITAHITKDYLSRFCSAYDIVQRSKAGKLMCSPTKTEHIEREVVFHIADVKRKLATGEYDEDCIFNLDETSLKVNRDNGRTLDFEGASHVSYMETTSRTEGFTDVMNVCGGRRGNSEPGFINFKNGQCNFPIRNVPDDVPGVPYRRGKKSWMDERVFIEMLGEKRFVKALPGGKTRVLFMDNVGSHKIFDLIVTALAEINTSVRLIHANSTRLTKPCDAFVISTFKQSWRALWDKKAEDIMKGMFRGKKGGSLLQLFLV